MIHDFINFIGRMLCVTFIFREGSISGNAFNISTCIIGEMISPQLHRLTHTTIGNFDANWV